MSSTRRRPRMGVRSFVLALLIIGGAMDSALTAGQAPPPPAGPEQGAVEPTGFRQFPGGKVVPDLRAGLPPRVAAAALRADADSQLPEGLRLRDDGEPFVAPVGGNSLFRFGLEYRGIRLADGSTYVAIVGRNGKLLSSRFQNIPHAVDATVPTVGASAAVAAATDHARNTLGQSGTLSETTPVLEVWVDAQQQGRLCWSMTRARNVGRARYGRPRSIRSPRSTRRRSCRGRTSSATTRSTRGLMSGTSLRTCQR